MVILEVLEVTAVAVTVFIDCGLTITGDAVMKLIVDLISLWGMPLRAAVVIGVTTKRLHEASSLIMEKIICIFLKFGNTEFVPLNLHWMTYNGHCRSDPKQCMM